MSGRSIRTARLEDAGEIARLAGQLGYPASAEMIQASLQRLLASPNDIIYVTESADGKLAGWIHAVLSQLLESEYRVEIAGLIVDEQFHRQGIGRELVARVETWASDHGVSHTVVRSRIERAEAHRFYKNLGYTQTKTQVVFRKSLA